MNAHQVIGFQRRCQEWTSGLKQFSAHRATEYCCVCSPKVDAHGHASRAWLKGLQSEFKHIQLRRLRELTRISSLRSWVGKISSPEVKWRRSNLLTRRSTRAQRWILNSEYIMLMAVT